jgi:hypothetical protein
MTVRISMLIRTIENNITTGMWLGLTSGVTIGLRS